MTNALSTTQPRKKWVATLDQAMPAIAASLPKSVTPEKFAQVAKTAIGSTPLLLQCFESNPQRVITALSQCAADGLLPDNKHAALVPFRIRGKGGQPDRLDLTYIPMIAGVLKRLRNSGEVASVNARIVRQNDKFDLVYGDDEKFEHRPCTDGDPGKPKGAYAIIKFHSGEVYREYMTQEEIQQVKASSRANNGPWSGPFELEMWRKTVLKRAAKYCPFADDISTLMDRDNNFYDPERTIEAKPSFAETFRAAPQVGYGDQIPTGPGVLDPDEPVRDVSDDEADMNEGVIEGSRPDDTQGSEGKMPADAAASDAPSNQGADQAASLTPPPASAPEPDAASKPDPQPEEQDPSLARFYAESMSQLRKIGSAQDAAAALRTIQDNPLYFELNDSQAEQLKAAAKREK